MKKRSIFKRAVSLLLAVICLPVLSSCFHDNWNIPEREEPDIDIGALLGGLLGGDLAVHGDHAAVKKIGALLIQETLSLDALDLISADGACHNSFSFIM